MTKEEKVKNKIKEIILNGMNWTGFDDLDSTVSEIYHFKLVTDEDLSDVTMRTWYFDCWDRNGKTCTKEVQATCEEHAVLKFEKINDGELGFDPPYAGYGLYKN